MNATTPQSHAQERRDLAATMRTVLLAATEERHLRGSWVQGHAGRELGWVVYERGQMLAAVNTERASRRLSAARVEDVMRAEQRAEGHSDYVAQFALGCADLVMAEGEMREGEHDR